MKKKHFLLSMMITTLTVFLFLTGCKKSETTQLTLSSLMAGDIDLNGAAAPNNVPVNPTIMAVFSTDVDASTATAGNIMLMQDYDNSMVDLNITTSGNAITIMPVSSLGNGALYKLSFGAGLMASNGTALTAIDRSFTTEGTFVPAGQIAYWNFENNANDQVGNYSPAAGGITAITYTASRSAEAGMAATFDGATSLIEIPNGDELENTDNFSLCFWVNADSTKHGQFVMGLAGFYGFQFEITGDYSWCKLAAQYDFGNGTSGSEDLYFPGDGSTRDNGGWQGWTFCRDLTSSGGVRALIASKWAQVVCVYDAPTKVGTMYINGEEMKAQDFNLWPDGDPKQGVVGLKYAGNPGNNAFVFGFIQDKNDPTITDPYGDYSDPGANHFKGQLDDVRFFHKALTANEVMLIYNSEKP